MFDANLNRELGIDAWPDDLRSSIEHRLSTNTHGDYPAWRAAIGALPQLPYNDPVLNAATVCVGPRRVDSDCTDTVRQALMRLCPWRKGPFCIAGVTVDAEWRSDRKWDRVVTAIEPLAGRRVLDVGCGNGYYALRMLGAGAKAVLGIDPTQLYVMQFQSLCHFAPGLPLAVLPMRLEEMPAAGQRFDSVFSMGVLYHQRAPIDHLRQLRDTLRPGGQLVLETLFLPGERAFARTPVDRYARMKNVWLLPTLTELQTWLARCRYDDIQVVDTSTTTTKEQRRTEWMPFESLQQALAPDDPSQTIEGWPAPRRVIVTAHA